MRSPFFYDQNEILHAKNDKILEFQKKDFYSFLHVKFHFGQKKWTSQKWCLEVHRTFSTEFRAKKRLSIVKTAINRV